MRLLRPQQGHGTGGLAGALGIACALRRPWGKMTAMHTTLLPGVARWSAGFLISLFALMGSACLQAQTYSFTVDKTKAYLQTNARPPVLDYDRPFMFQANACSDDDWFFFMSDVSLRPPGKPALAMNLTADMDCFRKDAAFATEPLLQAAFPDGTYACDIQDPLFGGTTTLQIALTGGHYPTPPFVINCGAAQQIYPSADFAIVFPPRSGTLIQDSLRLLIVEPTAAGQIAVYQTTAVMTPTTTNVLIPAGLLAPGKTYYGVLLFHRVSAFSQLGANQAAASYGALTQFPLHTVSGQGEVVLRILAMHLTQVTTARQNG